MSEFNLSKGSLECHIINAFKYLAFLSAEFFTDQWKLWICYANLTAEYAEWIEEEVGNSLGVCCSKLGGGFSWDCGSEDESSWILTMFWR